MAVLLIFSSVPATVFTFIELPDFKAVAAEPEEINKIGKISWSIDQNGTLTIDGKGAMEDFQSGKSPWYADRLSITKIVVNEGVSQIGSYAFQDCSKAVEVILPDSLVMLGDNVFRNCSSLKSVVIPENVKKIGYYIFNGCTSLTEITMPFIGTNKPDDATNYNLDYYFDKASDANKSSSHNMATNYLKLKKVTLTNTETLPAYAFAWCDNLTEVVLPDNLKKIGSYAFSDCDDISQVTIPESVKEIGSHCFDSCDGITEVFPMGSLNTIPEYAFNNCSAFTDISILPETISIIGKGAFANCKNLISFSLNEKIAEIGSYAFSGCSRLKTTSISNSLLKVGEYVFKDCVALKSVEIPESVTNIGYFIFNGCYNLEEITLPFIGTNNVNVTGNYHLDYYFDRADSPDKINIHNMATKYLYLKKVTLTNTEILPGYAFAGCDILDEIVLPQNLEKVGNYAFYKCTGLTEIVLPENLTKIGGYAFADCSGLVTVAIPANVNEIGNYVFSNCSALTSFTGIGKMTNIPQYMFNNCTSLSDISDIPSTVNTIGSGAFASCTALTAVTVPATIKNINSNAFENCTNLENITLSEGVEQIGEYTFKGCSSLVKVEIPESVYSIGNFIFNGCTALEEIVLPYVGTREPENNNSYNLNFYFDSIKLESSANALKTNYPLLKKVTLTDTEIIPAYAFAWCDGIEEIILPDNLRIIRSNAFNNCDGLTDFEFPATLVSTSSTAFAECDGLGELVVPADKYYAADFDWNVSGGILTVTGNGVMPDYQSGKAPWYESRNSINKVVVAEGITGIGDYAFSGLSYVTEISLPYSLKSVGEYAFKDCIRLTGMVIPENVNKMEYHMFYGCTNIRQLTLPYIGTREKNNNKNYNLGYYFDSSSIDRATTSDSYSVSTTYNHMGTSYPNLTKVTVTNTEILPNYAFFNCTTITEINLPESLKIIGKYAFSNCDAITDIAIPESVSKVGSYVFSKSDGLSGPIDLCGFKEIPDYAYSNCAGIVTLAYIPEGVEKIGNGAFASCSNLKKVNLREGVTTLGEYVFSDCERLSDIDLPDSLKSIGQHAFKKCIRLENAVIPEGTSSIGYYIFNGCTNLTELTLPFIGTKDVTSTNNYNLGYYFDSSSIDRATTSDGYSESTTYNHMGTSYPNLTKVTLTNTEILPDYAFANCTTISDINLPEKLEKIGQSAFINCTVLPGVDIPENVTSVGTYVFKNCDAFAKPVALGSVNRIPDYAYLGCDGITDLADIPESIIKIGEYAFKDCANITGGNIAEQIVSIAQYAFNNCTGLESAVIPEGTSSIGYYIFNGCTNLTELTLPFIGTKDVTSVKNYNLDYYFDSSNLSNSLDSDGYAENTNYHHMGTSYPNLTKVTLTNTEILPEYAFFNCTTLQEVILPEELKIIRKGAFMRCETLPKITISSNVTSIDTTAFDNCIAVIMCDPMSVAEEFAIDHEMPFEYIGGGNSITLIVQDEKGTPLDYGYSVKWYKDSGKTSVASGRTVHNIDLDSKYEYEVILDSEYGKKYYQTPRVTVEDNLVGRSVHVLDTIPKLTVKGTVTDEDGSSVSGATVTLKQIFNGTYTENIKAKTKSDGEFSVEISDVYTDAVISMDGYYTVTKSVISSKSGEKTIDIGTVKISELPTNKITLNLQKESPAPEGERGTLSTITNANNFVFTLYNHTQEKDITDFVVQYPYIIFGEVQVGADDELKVSAVDSNGNLSSAESECSLDGSGVGNATLIFKENGYIKATIENSLPVFMFVFDSDGHFVSRASSTTSEIMTENLADGRYDVVIIEKTNLLTAVSDIKKLEKFGLEKDKDYLLYEAKVKNGEIADFGTVSAVDFDESKLIYTVPESTNFTSNNTSVVSGKYITMKAAYKIDEKYETENQTVTIEIPEGLTFVEDSLNVNSKVHNYSFDGTTVEVKVNEPEGVIRFYVIAEKAGTYNLDAVLSFENSGDDMSQPIGSVNFEVTNAKLSVPDITSQLSFVVSGNAVASSKVEIFDNGVSVGETTSNKAGTWSATITLTDDTEGAYHNITALITNPLGIQYTADGGNTVYNTQACEVDKITMIYRGKEIVFKFREPDTSNHSYSFAPGTKNFTFVVDFLGDASKAEGVQVVTTSNSGVETVVDCIYDQEKNVWTGTAQYTSNTIPAGVSARFKDKTEKTVTTVAPEDIDKYKYEPGTDVDDNYNKPVAGSEITLEKISPNIGGAGNVTVCITGEKLEPSTVFTLSDGTRSYTAVKTYWQNHEKVYATFGLAKSVSGFYSLIATNGDNSATLDYCFTIDTALPKGKLSYDYHYTKSSDDLVLTYVAGGGSLKHAYHGPETIFEGSGTVSVTNVGYTDVAAPTLLFNDARVGYADRIYIHSDLDSFSYLSYRTLDFADDIVFLQNKEGLAGVLAHGQMSGCNFEYKIENNYKKYSEDDGKRPIDIIGSSHSGSGGSGLAGMLEWPYGVKSSMKEDIANSLDDYIIQLNGNVNTIPQSNSSEITEEEKLMSNITYSEMGSTFDLFAQSVSEMANELDATDGDITLDDIYSAYILNGIGAYSADVLESVTDITSLNQSFTRSWSSLFMSRPETGAFGYGWSDSGDIRAEYGGDNITLTSGSDVVRFIKNDSGKYVTEGIDAGFATVDSDGKITVTTNAGTVSVFDSDGKLLHTTDINGKRSECKYTLDGKLKSVEDSYGDKLEFDYNSNGYIKEIKAEKTGEKVTYDYDGIYLSTVTTKYGTTRYLYNKTKLGVLRGTLVKIIYPDGNIIDYTYDDNGRISKISNGEYTQYMKYGLKELTVSDNMDNSTFKKFDADGRVIWSKNASGNLTYVSYDENGNMKSLSNGLDNITEYEYDKSGSPSKITLADGTVNTYTYDEKGNVISVADGNGTITYYDHDQKGNTTAVRFPDGSKISYSYDELSRMTTFTKRSGGTVTYEYDKNDNVISETYSSGEKILYNYDGLDRLTVKIENGKRTEISYNQNNGVSKVTYPDGKYIEYAYDSLGRMVSVKDSSGYITGYTYDSKSRISAVTDGTDTIVSYTYNPDDTVSRKTNANGTYTDYVYVDGVISEIKNFSSSGKKISSYGYTYDSFGNISTVTDENGTWYFEYDEIGQLIRAIPPKGKSIAYAYDAAGNRISVTEGITETAYTSNNLNQYTKYGDVIREYDVDGNLVKETGSQGTATYSWNYLGQLIGYTDFEGNVYNYEYDSFGLRNKVTVNGKTTTYLNDPLAAGGAIASSDGYDTVHYSYTDKLVSSKSGDSSYYYNDNILGSVTEITGNNGEVVNKYTYNHEGDVISKSETIANPYTYAGTYGIVNDNNGLIYDRARYISTATDSFISIDPSGQNSELNVYRYANNNPVNLIDINGEVWIPCIAIGAGVGAIIGGAGTYLWYKWNGQPVNWKQVAINTGIGALGGAAIGAGVGGSIAANTYAGNFIGYHGLNALNSIPGKLLFDAPKSMLGWTPRLGGMPMLTQPWIRDGKEAIKDLGDKIKNIPQIGRNLPFKPSKGVIDPSGYVYEAVASNRLEGVTTTIYYEDYPKDAFGEPDYDAGLQKIEWVEAPDYDQINPQVTDAEGDYGWDVPEGNWIVKYEKEGYETLWSEWMYVPPEYTDVNVCLVTKTAPTVKSVKVYDSAVRIEFSQYMDMSTVNTNNITVTCGGTAVNGTIVPVNADYNYEKTAQYASVYEFVPDEKLSNEATVTISGVKNYAGIAIKKSYENTDKVEIRPESISVKGNVAFDYGEKYVLEIQVLPVVAGANKVVNITSSSPSVIEIDKTVVTTDENGKASVELTGKLPGAAVVGFALADTEITATCDVTSYNPYAETEGRCSRVEANVASGSELSNGSAIFLMTSTVDAKIYYTLDGSDPKNVENVSRKLFENPIAVTGDITIRAYAVKEGLEDSTVSEFTYSVIENSACVHGAFTVVDGKAATCTEQGTVQHLRCNNCGKCFTDMTASEEIKNIAISKTGHKETVIKAVSASCTKTGLTEGKKCTVCGKVTVSQKVVPVVAHTELKVAAKAATYKSTGLTEGKKCKICGKITLAQKVTAKLKLGKVTGLKAKKINVVKSSYVTLAWSKVAGAQKYEVYQQSGKKWKKIKTTSSASLTVKKLKPGSTYKFKVRAILSGEPSGAYSSVLTVKVVPGTPTLSVKAGKKQLTASWKTVSGVTGYEVQYSTSKKFTKKTTKTLTLKSKSKKTTIKKLSKGKKYYVRVRAYKKIGSKTYYGSYSSAKNVKVK